MSHRHCSTVCCARLRKRAENLTPKRLRTVRSYAARWSLRCTCSGIIPNSWIENCFVAVRFCCTPLTGFICAAHKQPIRCGGPGAGTAQQSFTCNGFGAHKRPRQCLRSRGAVGLHGKNLKWQKCHGATFICAFGERSAVPSLPSPRGQHACTVAPNATPAIDILVAPRGLDVFYVLCVGGGGVFVPLDE